MNASRLQVISSSDIVKWSSLEIDYLQDRKDKFIHYPFCQRDFVWKITMQRKLIDSIFKGYPIPPLILHERHDELLGKSYEVLDGQQRIETIIRFLDGKFTTAKRFSDEPGEKPYAPGKTFSGLNLHDKNVFLNSQLLVLFVRLPENGNYSEYGHDVSYNNDDTVGAMFRRLQYQTPLNFSEKLWSYRSPARKVGQEIVAHECWKEIYKGRSDRKQIYQMVLMVMLMEDKDIFVNLTTPRLLDVASGKNIHIDLSETFVKKVRQRLDLIRYLYEGSDIRAMLHIIPIYQSIMLLEQDKFNLKNSTKGCLSVWFNELREEALKQRQTRFDNDTFSILTKVVAQREFWEKQLNVLYNISGLVRLDKRRTFNQLERLKAFRVQGGKCPRCNKTVSINDDAHHIEEYSNSGRTIDNNCVLVHYQCHTSLS